MKFLEKYDFNKEEIADFLNNTPKKLIDAIKDKKDLVSANIEYLKDLGVTNYKEIFLEYYDTFLMDYSNFTGTLNQYEPEDLIEKLKENIKVFEHL